MRNAEESLQELKASIKGEGFQCHLETGEDLVFVDADFNGFLITEMIVNE